MNTGCSSNSSRLLFSFICVMHPYKFPIESSTPMSLQSSQSLIFTLFRRMGIWSTEYLLNLVTYDFSSLVGLFWLHPEVYQLLMLLSFIKRCQRSTSKFLQCSVHVLTYLLEKLNNLWSHNFKNGTTVRHLIFIQ